MLKRFVSLIIFFVLLQAGPAGAAVSRDSRKELTAELMQASGITMQINQIRNLMSFGFSRANVSADPAKVKIIKEAMLSAADPKKMLEDISQYMEKHLDAATMKNVIVWLNTDLGKKVTSLEESASTVRGQKEKVDYIMKLRTSPPPRERLLLVRKLMESTNSGKAEADAVLSVVAAPIKALNSVLPQDKRMGDRALNKMIENIRRKALAVSANAQMAGSLYTYRTLSDSELQSYIRFLKSESGRKFYRVSLSAYEKALTEMSGNLTTALTGAFRKIMAGKKEAGPSQTIVHMKTGQVLQWDNYHKQGNQDCTRVYGGLFCVNNSEVSSIVSN